MNRTDLQNLANIRIAEAAALLAAGHPSGAYYLAGYSVECALKAVIARQTQLHDFPDKQRANESFVHDLERLARVAKLTAVLQDATSKSKGFERNWATVVEWSEAARYEIYSIAEATTMIDAVEDTREGVLPWITQFW